MSEPVRGRRGVLATILLVLMTIGNAGGALLVLVAINGHRQSGQVPLLWSVLVLQLAALVGLGAIWAWRRWGLYVYGAALAVNLALGLATRARLLTLLLPVAFFAALVAVLRPRWPE